MNPHPRFAATFFSLLGAVFLWSSWAVQRRAPAPPAALIQPPPAAKTVLAPEERLRAVATLNAALKEPAGITKKDAKAVKRALGKDGERLLELLRRTAR